MKKFLNSMILLLAVSVLFISCDDANAPREATSEDRAIVNSIADDIQATNEDEDAGKEALGPYLDVIINGLFSGEGTTVDGVNLKFTDPNYKYEAAKQDDVEFEKLPLTITLDNVDITSGEYSGKSVSGNITLSYDESTQQQKIEGELTGGDICYSGTVEEFYKQIFSEHIILQCAKDFLAEGVTLEGEELKVYAKGTIEYAYGKDDGGNDNGNIAFKKITITDFKLETKEDIQLTKNKYSLNITGTTELNFTNDVACEDEDLSSMNINATMVLGITNATESHSIEISSNISYPYTRLPFNLNVTNAKIDGQQISNDSMSGLLVRLFLGILDN